jgi:hypothetical protein
MNRAGIYLYLPHRDFLYRNEKEILFVILSVAFLLRVGICFFSGMANMHIDTFDYYKQADAIVAGSFINYFPNGYPFLIALLKAVSTTGFSTALLWMNIFMGVGTVFFVYHIARSLSSKVTVALLAAILTAVFPSQVNYARWLLSEVPAVFFLTGFYCFYLKQKDVTAGLMMAMAVIIRTELLPVIFIIIVLEYFLRKKARWVLLICFTMPVAATAYYCYIQTGTFAIAGHSKVNIMYSVTAAGDAIDWYFMNKHPEVQTAAQARQLYIQFALEHPLQFIQNKLANLWELWGFFPSSSGGNRGLGARLLIGCSNLFLLLFGIAGWWRNRKSWVATCLLLPFLIVTVVHTLLLAFPRYTFAAEPFLIIFASDALVQFFSAKRKFL